MRLFHNSILVIFCSLFLNSCSENNDFENTKVSKNESDVQTNSDNSDNNDTGTESAGFIISAISGVTDETGTTATFTIKLKTQPLANVSISVSSSDATEGSVNPSSLVFSSSNWNNEQTVTVTGVDDTALDGNQSFTVLLGSASSSDSNYSGLDPNDVTVTNNDDDTAGYTVSKTTDNTSEDGSTFTFTVKLNSQPSSDVTISLSTTDTSEGAVSPSSLTFTSSNWSTLQTAAVFGVDDDAVDGNQSFTVTIGAGSSSDSNYNGLNPDDLTVINLDDDVAGFTLNPSSGTTSENGGITEFSLKLNSQPSANVTISVTSSNTSEATVSASSLTFTDSNWSTAQTITVTGVDDSTSDGNVSYTIILASASSSDSNYNNLNPSDFSGSNTDDDTAGFTLNGGTDNTSEIADTSKFTLKLNSQPSADVTVSMASSDTTEGTVSPSSLTFTNSNWNTAQTVTATGVDDNTSDGNISYTITTGTASSSDSNYNSLNPNDITISNLDDEWNGAKQTGSTDKQDMGNKLVNDSEGNGYIIGNTYGNFDGNSNPNNGVEDIFILKYSLNGSTLWKKQYDIIDQRESVGGIDIDSNNNIYISGHANIVFNGVSGNIADLFILKMNTSGEIQWTQLFGGSGYEEAYDSVVDSLGNVFITGNTTGDLDGNTNLGSSTADMFLIKYNSSGIKQWTKQFGTSNNDYGFALDVDSSGNIYVGGIVGGSYDGNTSSGRPDTVLIKFNSSGTKQWSKQKGSYSYSDNVNDVAVDSSGDVYILGQVNGTIDGNTPIGSDDYFLMKYNSSGTKQWSKTFGSTQADDGLRMDFDSSDNIFVVGWTKGDLNGNTNSGDKDLFITKINSSGTIQWTKLYGSSLEEVGQGIDIDSRNNIFVAGYIRTGGHYDTIDVLFLKYDSDGNLQ